MAGHATSIDVTGLVEVGSMDDGYAYITRCVCGERFEYWPFFIIKVGPENARPCPKCGRRLWFAYQVIVYQDGSAEDATK